MKRRIFGLLLVLTLLLALPFAAAAAGTKEVTLTMTENTWTYTDTVTFSVKGPDGEEVPNGEVVVWNSVGTILCGVNNGAANISASELVSKLGLTLGQAAEISVTYTPSSGSDYDVTACNLTITVNKAVLTSVELTSTGYAYGAPTSGFSVASADAHVTLRDVSIYESETGVKDTAFGEKAYEVHLQPTTDTGYSLAPDAAVTLDGKTGKNVGDGYYVFQLDELYPTYTITYNLDGGILSNGPGSYDKHSGTVTIPNPTKDGYKFLGWTGEGMTEPQKDVSFEAKEMNRNLTYTANWEQIVYYDVEFITKHGTAPQTQQVESGTTATKPDDPTEDGWKFKGWYRSDDYIGEPFDFTTAIMGDTTLHAKWAQTFTVTFDANGHGTAPVAQTVEGGEKASKPADLTAEGYSFQGWYTDTGYTTEYDFSKEVTEDITLYAKWVKKPVVTFNVGGHGTAPADQTVELGGKATKPTDPTAAGYVFKGWYTNQLYTTEFDFNTPITADTTLYAKWTETYTVTFNVGGHGTAPAAQTVEKDGKAAKPENPTAKGWRFDGWYTDEKCTKLYNFNTAVTADMTLYAKWTQMFTLTFETNGGTKIDSVEAPDGSLVYLGSYKPTKSGYHFAGWYTDKNLTRESRVSYVKMDGNKTVYAKFAVADKTNPKTADPAMPGLALGILSFSTIGLAAVGFKKRK